jgi:acetoin:2,6-dichlorophenolindophenol oxidoreductase subunit beta
MSVMTYAEAGKRALAEEMRANSKVWAVGEDLGRGGVFGQYAGLQEEFGPKRVVDAPISEAAILGTAVGAAMMDTRPVVEMRFSDFALCAIDELVNQAAKARYMFGGQTRVPLVVREPVGMWRASAAQHSQSLESWYTHVPGLVVVMPATPADNYGLLRSAIQCDDPVVYMEHKGLWPLEGEVADGDHTVGDHTVEIGKARTARSGSDITLISWSKMVHECMDAAEQLADEGINAEVIDLRTLWPWDEATVLASVARTGRALIVHEAVRVGGFGAEVAATINELAFSELRGPVQRLAPPRALISYSPPLERQVQISADQVKSAVRGMLA